MGNVLSQFGSWFQEKMSDPVKRPFEKPEQQLRAAPEAPEQAGIGGEAPVTTKKKKAGRYRSVLTSPLGIGGEASAARKTLLGM